MTPKEINHRTYFDKLNMTWRVCQSELVEDIASGENYLNED